MDFQTYIPLALRTARLFDWPRANAQHASLGLQTELGEFASEVKRMFAYDKPMTEQMRQRMIEEGGDVMWYVPLGLLAMELRELPEPDWRVHQPAHNLPDLCVQMAMFVGAFSAFGVEAQPSVRLNAAQALSGLVRCMEAAAIILGTTGDQMRAQNILKLQKRFPDKFDAAAAEARADKGGASHLES